MAKYNIDSLNYMAIGKNRVFINMDISHYDISSHTYILNTENHPGMLSGPGLPSDFSGLDVNEKAGINAELSDGTTPGIEIKLSSSTSQYLSAVEEFNAHKKIPNSTFVLDDLPARINGGKDTSKEMQHVKNMYQMPGVEYRDKWIFPMYQVKDVCVKQNSQHKIKNPTVYSGDRNFDIYSTALDEDPIGFCQAGNGSFMLTRETKFAPYQSRTNLVDERTKAYDTTYYKYAISTSHMPTYLYNTIDEQMRQMSSDSAEAVFEPAVDMAGISYNYVIEMDHAKQSFYDNGDIFGQINTTKNVYDPVYSMNMTGRTEISACRTYVGIGSGRGNLSKPQPYLKFMDDVSYSGQINFGISADMNANPKKYTYQKLEYVYPTKFSGNANHKSTLFSVSIGDSGILSVENEYKLNLERSANADERNKNIERLAAIERLKRDIKSAVREIASNVSPANTQLFDTYFEGD